MSTRWQRFISLTFASNLFGQAAQYDQCKDPLFETHWAGKNDIPTLTSFPTVNTNLRICPAFNERASCCSQSFETEQSKYFAFWRSVLLGKFWRVTGHRASVLAASQAAQLNGTASNTDLEQLEVVKRRYQQLLDPAAQTECLTSILTYVAGMMCFSCKPEWFQYAVISSQNMAADHLLRVRMARSVCVELWAACAPLGAAVASLRAAVRDSRLARAALRAEESFDMFLSQRQLCNWAHDAIALHPFKQPSREEQNVQAQKPAAAPAPIAQRRLDEDMKRSLDVMADGRASGFPRTWQGQQMISQASPLCAMKSAIVAFWWILASLLGTLG